MHIHIYKSVAAAVRAAQCRTAMCWACVDVNRSVREAALRVCASVALCGELRTDWYELFKLCIL